MLEQEARALLTRLARVKPFALQETMLPAAELMPDAQMAIENYLIRGRQAICAGSSTSSSSGFAPRSSVRCPRPKRSAGSRFCGFASTLC